MKPITAIILGAGQRGANVYGGYALNFPNELKIVGVAEPRADRRAAFAQGARHSRRPLLCRLGGRAQTGQIRRLCIRLYTRPDALSSRSCRRWKRAMTCCAKSR